MTERGYGRLGHGAEVFARWVLLTSHRNVVADGRFSRPDDTAKSKRRAFED